MKGGDDDGGGHGDGDDITVSWHHVDEVDKDENQHKYDAVADADSEQTEARSYDNTARTL